MIHLNGPPGVGKSTLARRYAAENPGTLCLDIDVLRTWVGGWEQDFEAAGEQVRTTALAMITAWVVTGHDVVVPQLVGDPRQLDRFRSAASDGGADFTTVMVWTGLTESVRRFRARPVERPADRAVRELVDAAGDDRLVHHHGALALVLDDGLLVETVAGDVESTYEALSAALRDVT